jgi:ParB-like chromosome segregation protein Spo0J
MGIKIQAFASAAGISRGDLWFFPPTKPTKDLGGLIIIGLDTKDVRGSHRLWREDCREAAPEGLVASIRKHGVLQPIRARKIEKNDNDRAEVVVGRDRTKAARVIAGEGVSIKIPVMLFSHDATDEEIIGAANAENYQRKTENLRHQSEHLFMQATAAGHPANPDALPMVATSTGVSTQRLKTMFAFRANKALVAAYDAGTIKGEVALALVSLPDEQLAKELARIAADPTAGTVAEVRERVSYQKRNATVTFSAMQDPEPDTTESPTGRLDVPTKPTAQNIKPPKAPKAPDAHPGLGKHLQKRVIDDQMDIPADERDLDALVLKTLKVCAGLAAPNTIPGFAKALKRLGL